jgi:hypothetical protein
MLVFPRSLLLALCVWPLSACDLSSAAAVEDSEPAPVGPRLSISGSGGGYLLSWPELNGEWVLESSVHLETVTPWVRVSRTLYQTNNGLLFVSVPPEAGNRFYRLRKLLSPALLPQGLTGYWQLDEASGEFSEDVTATAGTLFLANVGWAPGRIGPAALRFTGPSGNGESRAWVTNANYRLLPPAGRPFSLSFWFSADALLQGRQGLAGQNANPTNGWSLALSNAGLGTNLLMLAGNTAESSLSMTGRTLLLPGQWHELTLAHDGNNTTIYLDAVMLGRGTGAVPIHEGPIYFGGGLESCDSFSGRIDEIRIYTNCLTHEEISLTGNWRFNENNGPFTADSSMKGHHATLTDPSSAWSFGREGPGIELSASHVIISNDDYGVLPASGGSFSLSFWIYSHGLVTGRNGLMSCGDTNSGWDVGVDVDHPGENTLYFSSINSGGTLNLRTSLTLSNAVWTRLDLTYNGGIATAYVNGRKVHYESGAIRGTRAQLMVGSASDAVNFNGVIDELKIYNRERDAAEIGPVAMTMWETAWVNEATNLTLQGFGPRGKPLTYAIVPLALPTNGAVVNFSGSSNVTFQAGGRKGPDAFAYTVSDGEFTSEPAIVAMSVVEPHWVSPLGGSVQPRDGSSADRAWEAADASALDRIWKTNNSYDCFLYLPGEYLTRGWRFSDRPTANPGCKHIGSGSAGPDQTTIKLVDTLEPFEGVIFATAHSMVTCDGFEVHRMKLDCNANNNPQYATGKPVRLRVPLTAVEWVNSVTLRWSHTMIPRGVILYRLGHTVEGSLCTFAAGSQTSCTPLHPAGGIDVVDIEAPADELVLEFTRRANDVDFYSLAELEVNGAAVSLPRATAENGMASQLDAQHPGIALADGNWGTSWASGAEGAVRISLPLATGTPVSQVNLYWNCQTLDEIGRLGPAADYAIEARNEATGQYESVSFVRHSRTVDGLEINTFGTAQSANVIRTDELVIRLNQPEPTVNFYSLREVTLQNGFATVALRVPTADSIATWGGPYEFLRVFDGDPGTSWASATQGMIAAFDVRGSNMKFTQLQIVGFGSKAGRECFPMFIVAASGPAGPRHLGNVLVDDCTFANPATNTTEGMTIVSLTANPPETLTNAFIRRCEIKGLRNRVPLSQAFSAIHVENCRVEDCTKAVYFEPDPFAMDDIGPVLLRSNQFVNVDTAVQFLFHPSGQFDSITLLDNEMVLTGTSGWGFGPCDVCAAGPSGSITNVTALNNIVRYAGWAPRPLNQDGGLLYSDIHHAVFANNILALGTAHSIRVRQYPAGIIYPPPVTEDCEGRHVPPPDNISYPPSLDPLRPGYRRAWYNNRNLSGALLGVGFSLGGTDGFASQQQWPE